MPKQSAGIVLFRRRGEQLEVLLGHSGGPFWQRRDAGAWSIPKGEYDDGEAALAAARREFSEELGLPVPEGPAISLGCIKQKNGKVVTAWAVEGDLAPDSITPGTFPLEWPKGSGRIVDFPEVDRVAWFDPDEARGRMIAGQAALLDRLLEVVSREGWVAREG
jgi:predicted NUDIX family NTP pyrophosphohydrolase